MADDLTSVELVDQGDLDELTRQVDRLCGRADWDGLLDLRDLCRAALARGRQLWPVAAHCEYRLSLEAPGPWAAAMLESGTGHFALGPLPEVAAARHTWAELAPHVPKGPVSALAAHERVVRGEDLTGDDRVDASVLELPLALQPWEPAYPVAIYKPATAEFPGPMLRRLGPAMDLEPNAPEVIEDPDACRALAELATPWVTESNGRVETVCVEGDALGAVRSLGVRSVRWSEIGGDEALAHMAWTAASGGAHGRRRGMAAGRFGSWWALAALAGWRDDWPIPPADLGAALARLHWYLWDGAEPSTGWSLRLAAEDHGEGLAWAISANDSG